MVKFYILTKEEKLNKEYRIIIHNRITCNIIGSGFKVRR